VKVKKHKSQTQFNPTVPCQTITGQQPQARKKQEIEAKNKKPPAQLGSVKDR